MKSLYTILAAAILTVFFGFKASGQQQINGGSGQGLMSAILEAPSSEKLKNFKNITPEKGLGWWRVRISAVRFAWEGLHVVIDYDIDNPSLVYGYTASGGEKSYSLSELGANITGSVKFRITGAYTDLRTKERKTFTKNIAVWKFGKTTSDELELFGYSGSVKDMTMSQLLAKLDVRITSIEPIEKHISGYTRADQEVGKIIEKGKKETSLNNQIAYAQNAESLGRTDDAIQYYEDAYKIKQDPVVKAKIDELKKRKQAESKKQEADNLKNQAYKAERTGEFEVAKRLYEQANTVYPNTDTQNDIVRMKGEIEEKTENNTSSLPSSSSSGGGGITLTRTSSSGSSDGQTKIENEKNEETESQLSTYQKQAIEMQARSARGRTGTVQTNNINNDALVRQGQSISQQSKVLEQGIYASAAALSNSIGALFGDPLKNAKVVNGVTVIYSKKDKKIMREMEEERAELQKQAKIARLKNSRLKFFSFFPSGSLPSISKNMNDDILYYFMYAYEEKELVLYNPSAKLSNIFSIRKFPDGTWALNREIKDKASSSFASPDYIICGPFRNFSDASKIWQSFKDNIGSVDMEVKTIHLPNFGAVSN